LLRGTRLVKYINEKYITTKPYIELGVVVMMSKHPLDFLKNGKLSSQEVAEALRLSIIAELDAINLYLQLARAIDDERIRRVFEDVANEERTHVGEFLTLLKSLDPKQVEELSKGAEEVKELTGISIQGAGASSGSGADPASNMGTTNPFELVKKAFIETLNENRLLRRHIQVVNLGRGVESTVIEKAGETLQRVVIPLRELSVYFRVSQRELDYAERVGTSIESPDLYQASQRLALMEDNLILEAIIGSPEAQKDRLGDWSSEGVAVTDVARAAGKLYSAGAGRPLVLVVDPVNYVNMVRASGKTGLLELDRVKSLVDDIVATPIIGENKVVVFSARPYVLDLVTGGDIVVDYIGPEKDAHLFRAWEMVALRIKQGAGIVVLER